VKNIFSSVKDTMTSRYLSEDKKLDEGKSTNINILLNRVRQDQKKESRKKLLFTAATSLGVVLFGVLIF
tara:strand:+ start:401 stop:607 length:207 start_codon:yes stop_codon:yes gene_type:complete